MSRAIIGSRAELVAALRKRKPTPATAERIRVLLEELFLDALFLAAQFPGGRVPEAAKCCYAFDLRACAALCRAAWAEEAFWCGLVRVAHAGPRKVTRLMCAAHRGDAARVAWLLARGAPKEVADAKGWTALHWASFHGRADAVRALLAAGASAGAEDANGVAPLFFAARNGHVKAARALIEAGASVEAEVKSYGFRPLHVAALEGRDAVAALLLDAGTDGGAKCAAGYGPRLYAKTPALRALLAARGCA